MSHWSWMICGVRAVSGLVGGGLLGYFGGGEDERRVYLWWDGMVIMILLGEDSLNG